MHMLYIQIYTYLQEEMDALENCCETSPAWVEALLPFEAPDDPALRTFLASMQAHVYVRMLCVCVGVCVCVRVCVRARAPLRDFYTHMLVRECVYARVCGCVRG